MLLLITNSSLLVEGAVGIDTCCPILANDSWNVNLFSIKPKEIYVGTSTAMRETYQYYWANLATASE